MTSAVAAFGIAVGAISLVCYVLMTRLQKRRGNRGFSGDGLSPDSANYAAGDGWTIAQWFGGGSSIIDGSGNPVDSGGGGDGEAAMVEAAAVAINWSTILTSRVRGLLD